MIDRPTTVSIGGSSRTGLLIVLERSGEVMKTDKAYVTGPSQKSSLLPSGTAEFYLGIAGRKDAFEKRPQ